MIARPEEAGRFARSQAGAHRNTAGQAFGEGRHVGHDARVLEAEPRTSAADAALNFVADHQPSVFIAQLTHAALEIEVGHVDATLALHRLIHHGDDGFVVLGHFADRRQIVVRHAQKTGDQRLEACLDLAVSRRRQGRHRAPMERLLHHHDGRILDAALVAVETRQLDRRLIGLTAGVAEEDFLHPRNRAQAIGELLLQGHLIEVGGMQQAARLRSDRRHQLGMVVTQRVHRDARQGIEVKLAFGIGHPASVAMTESNWQPGVSVHDMRHVNHPNEAH